MGMRESMLNIHIILLSLLKITFALETLQVFGIKASDY